LPLFPGWNIRQQIDYLIALSYELEGQKEQAVQSYLTLAREKPQTFWSNLAAAHLERKP
jgi:lipopolysaccharide biosynthesis regulator YciM